MVDPAGIQRHRRRRGDINLREACRSGTCGESHTSGATDPRRRVCSLASNVNVRRDFGARVPALSTFGAEEASPGGVSGRRQQRAESPARQPHVAVREPPRATARVGCSCRRIAFGTKTRPRLGHRDTSDHVRLRSGARSRAAYVRGADEVATLGLGQEDSRSR